jgi:hypothetical protein
MPVVTVQSAHSTTVSLSYDSGANALLATFVRDAISAGLGGGTVFPFAGNSGPTPPIPSGETGEWVQNAPGAINLGHGWDDIVDAASNAIITGPTDPGVQVLAGAGNLNFNAAGGSGSVIAGGGNDQVVVPVFNANPWFIALGNGNDVVKTLGSGNDTISLGAGADSVQLGAGGTALTVGGAATVTASTGSETVTAMGTALVNGGSSNLLFLGGGGATVFGQAGAATVTGGSGPDEFHGGTGGINILKAGVGAATLFGGHDGDQLFANGSGAQILFAATGNETLTGSSVGGASDTFVASAGADTVVTNTGINSVFEFIHGSAGGAESVSGLTAIGQVQIHLAGYAANDLTQVGSQDNAGGNLHVTLNDGTHITFANVGSPLTNGNFV